MKRSLIWPLCLLFIASGVALTGCDEDDEVDVEDITDELDIEDDADTDDEEDDEDDEETAEAPDEPVIGELAPDFTLVDEEGESHTLSDYQGKTVVLEWFNIPCPYVVRHYEEGTFDTIIDEFGGDDFVWLAIDTTFDNTPEDTLEWKAETADDRDHDYPVLQDPDGDVGRLYNARTTPHMFVINDEGILEYMGGIDDDVRGREELEDRQRYVYDALHAMAEGEEVSPTEAEPYGCTVKYDEDS